MAIGWPKGVVPGISGGISLGGYLWVDNYLWVGTVRTCTTGSLAGSHGLGNCVYGLLHSLPLSYSTSVLVSQSIL